MNCAKCGGRLDSIGTAEGVELDFCSSCKGILFDHGEVAEYFELARDIPDLRAMVMKGRRTDRKCPKCGGAWLEIPYDQEDDLLIDLCTRCGVVWLDYGEFPKLERIAARMSDPKSKLLRAVKLVEDKGYQVIGWKKGV